MRKLTNESFDEKRAAVWADKHPGQPLPKRKTDYIGANDAMVFECHKHGQYTQKPKKHLEGQRCPKCGKEVWTEKRGRDTEKFIQESREIHGDRFDYSKTKYKVDRENVCIICPEHGEFWQTPASHIHQKAGCPKCANKASAKARMMALQDFKQKASDKFNGKYSYEEVKEDAWKGVHTKIPIICPEHGIFWKAGDKHLYDAQGCPKCAGSLGEKLIHRILQRSSIAFDDQYLISSKIIGKPFNCSARFDFVLYDGNGGVGGLVEYDGEFHFQTGWYHATEELQLKKLQSYSERDKRKADYCKEQGIPLLRVPYTWLKKEEKVETLVNDFITQIKNPKCKPESLRKARVEITRLYRLRDKRIEDMSK